MNIVAEPLALPDKPSIAVPPFENLSSDPERNYFSDGMAEEIVRGVSDDSESNLQLASEAAERAVALDSRDPAACCALGRVLIFKHAYERSVAAMKAAFSLNANLDRACYGLGMAFLYGGNPERGIPQFEAGLRMSPRSPVLWAHWTMLGLAYISSGKIEAAAESFESVNEQPNAAYMAFAYAAAAFGPLGPD